ncbi:MAG: glycosyl hydrolase family 25 [Bacteroidales bacterium]|nr:glycosyl hydrolase family 25 [Bacteroidales bacterium]
MKYPCRQHLPIVFLVLAMSLTVTLQAQGIDVSKFQGTINWQKVAKSKKVKFVYIRATEGTSIKDPKYKANVDSARNYKIYVGSYHVYSSKTTAYQQFANFKSVVSKKKQDLIPVLDIEGHHSGRLDMARVNKLLELMEKEYGAKPMIYTSEKVYREHFAGKRYRAYHIFIANYHGTPTVRYTLWQHSTTGRISGIKGDVDLDKFHKKHSLYDILMPKHRKKQAPAADSTAKKCDSTKRDSTKAPATK